MTPSPNIARFLRANNRALVAATALLLWLPILTMPFDRSPRYGPDPIPYPKLEAGFEAFVTYPLRLEAWFDTHFGLRSRLIRTHSLLCHRILRVSPSPKVVLGKDDWMFYNGDPANRDYSPLDDYRGIQPLSPLKLEQIRWMIRDQAEWLAARNIAYLFVLVPAKPLLHSEALPASVVRISDQTAAEQLAHHLAASDPNLPFLDLTDPLRRAMADYNVCVKTDSHWNDYGAFVATQTILERLALPGATPKRLLDYRIETVARANGDLLRMTDLTDAVEDSFVQLTPRFTPQSEAQPVSDEDLADILAGTGNDGQPTAVVYRDSFTTRLIPFLSEAFRSVRYVWARDGTRMWGIEDERPAAVIQIMSDRALRLDLRYSIPMQSELTRRRFAQSTNAMLRIDSPDAFAQVTGAPADAFSATADGLDVRVHHNEPIFPLPVIEGLDEFLSILRVEIDAPAPGGLTLHGPNLKLLEPLREGPNTAFYILMDPQTGQPLRLSVGGTPGTYRIRSIEMRGLPR